MNEIALEKAISYFGSASSLARKLGIHRSNIYSWKHHYSRIPLEYALQIDFLTQGEISWKELVPYTVVHRLRFLTLCSQETINFTPCELRYISLQRIHHTFPINFKPNSSENAGERFIGIDENNRLIFGQQKLYRYRQSKKRTVPAWRICLTDIIKNRITPLALANTFLFTERVAIGIALENFLKELRKEKKQEKSNLFLPPKGIKIRQFLAEKLAFGSHYTYQKAKYVYQKGHEKIIQLVNDNQLAVSTAALICKLSPQEQRIISKKTKSEIIRIAYKLKSIKSR